MSGQRFCASHSPKKMVQDRQVRSSVCGAPPIGRGRFGFLETIMSLRQKLQQLSPQQRSALADALYPDVAAKMKSPEEVDKIRKVGRHRVAPRLYLNVDRRGTRSWIFRYMHDGKSREMGLGSYPKVSLAVAHARVHHLRQKVFHPVDVAHEAEKGKHAEDPAAVETHVLARDGAIYEEEVAR